MKSGVVTTMLPSAPSSVGIATLHSFVQNAPACDLPREPVEGLGSVRNDSAVTTR
jgi:hypothetical protein